MPQVFSGLLELKTHIYISHLCTWTIVCSALLITVIISSQLPVSLWLNNCSVHWYYFVCIVCFAWLIAVTIKAVFCLHLWLNNYSVHQYFFHGKKLPATVLIKTKWSLRVVVCTLLYRLIKTCTLTVTSTSKTSFHPHYKFKNQYRHVRRLISSLIKSSDIQRFTHSTVLHGTYYNWSLKHQNKTAYLNGCSLVKLKHRTCMNAVNMN